MDLLQTRRARVGQCDGLGEQLQSSVSALSQAEHAQVPDHHAGYSPRGEIKLLGRELWARARSPSARCASAAVERQATAPGLEIP